jgi:hypothetical protein
MAPVLPESALADLDRRLAASDAAAVDAEVGPGLMPDPVVAGGW